MEIEKEFKIDQWITLRLVGEKTRIIITDLHGEETQFLRCKFLLIVIPRNRIRESDHLNSIDDISKNYSNELENTLPKDLFITPEQEFRGHCSNIQAWVENDYDPRVLHSSLSYDLARALLKAGNIGVKMKLIDHLVTRYNENKKYSDYRACQFLILFLTYAEIKMLCDNNISIYRDLIGYLWYGDLRDEKLSSLSKLLDTDIFTRGKLFLKDSHLDSRLRGKNVCLIIQRLLDHKYARMKIINRYKPKINQMRSYIKIKTDHCFFEGWIVTSTRYGRFEIKKYSGLIGYRNDKDSVVKITDSDFSFVYKGNDIYITEGYGFREELVEFLKLSCFAYVFEIERTEFDLTQKNKKKSF
jgi:hypothetical protein